MKACLAGLCGALVVVGVGVHAGNVSYLVFGRGLLSGSMVRAHWSSWAAGWQGGAAQQRAGGWRIVSSTVL